MKSAPRILLLFQALTLLGMISVSRGQNSEDYELPPVNYSTTQPTDVITRLESRLKSGELRFEGEDKQVVEALLQELHIPRESQLLVFSKTSLQRGRIDPESPRAIYFSDTCYVGWVPGGLMEVASIDPTLGPVFYAFDPRSVTNGVRHFVRDSDCMRCHGGTFVPHVPAVFARSVFADAEGEPLLRQGSQVVDYRTPFSERWGGWYVTGKHGKALHRGNVFASEKDDHLVAEFARGANVTNLSSFFSTRKYLTGRSDIVALLVFEHQLAMHTALTKASFNCRRMLDYQRTLQKALKDPLTDEPAYDSVKSVFESCARDVVNCLLFKDEAVLPDGIVGDPAFPKAFQANARRTAEGDSLKELSLEGRLFKNRCSYEIYSDLFLEMPRQLKERIYQRLVKALDSKSPAPDYAYIGLDERRRIVRILAETHPDLGSRLKSL